MAQDFNASNLFVITTPTDTTVTQAAGSDSHAVLGTETITTNMTVNPNPSSDDSQYEFTDQSPAAGNAPASPTY